MSVTLLCVRHGNTFQQGEVVTYVGARTDLPLVETQRASAVGRYLIQTKQVPDVIFTGPLLRHTQTASIIQEIIGLQSDLQIIDGFKEIDYGIDENKPAKDVEQRIGKEALESWHTQAIVPPGWHVDIKAIQSTWQSFATFLLKEYVNQTALIVTSNGILRFAHCLFPDPNLFKQQQRLHMKTGSLSIIEHKQHWQCDQWDINPYKLGY